MAPIVSVVIPTYKRPASLRRCIETLRAQTMHREDYEIIVADDAAEESTWQLVQEYAGAPVVRWIPVVSHRGPAGARNCGWRNARAPLIAFTDDDCRPQADWLETALSCIGSAAALWGHTIVPLRADPTDFEKNTSGLSSAGFITANCFVRKDALEAVGGFDARFTRAWREDSDLYFSLLEAGFTVQHAPDVVVVHPATPGPWGISIQQQKNNFFEALLFKKHRHLYRRCIGPGTPWDYYVIVLSPVAAALFAILGRDGLTLASAILWGILTLRFIFRRLRGTSRRLNHVVEMVVTSVAIPFHAVYWRMKGALRFKAFLP